MPYFSKEDVENIIHLIETSFLPPEARYVSFSEGNIITQKVKFIVLDKLTNQRVLVTESKRESHDYITRHVFDQIAFNRFLNTWKIL